VDPRNLPCGESACHECIVKSIDNNLSKQFQCSFCDQIHELVDKQGFPKNKTASKLIKTKAEEIYRYKSFEDLKAKLSEMRRKSEDLKIEIDADDGIDQIQDEFAKLRNLVHLRTEMLIEQVHQINESMIAKINENEKECIRSFDDKIGEFRKKFRVLITELDDFYDIKSKYVTQFKIDKKVVKESLVRTIGLIRKLDSENDNLKNIKFNNRVFQLENSSFKFEEKHVGRLSDNLLAELSRSTSAYKFFTISDVQ
jgi:hypothetical protein